MKYMGSKRRIAKELLAIMLPHIERSGVYVEPFVGGANMIEHVPDRFVRIGADVNNYLIATFKHMQDRGVDFPHVGEELYQSIRKNKEAYPDWLVGYAGFSLSFGGKWWGGYRRDKAGVRNYENESQQNLKSQQPLLEGVEWFCCSYLDLEIPDNSVIYCDPPYKGTTGYKDKFDHEAFYDWCRSMASRGHVVFVSEYQMPDDFQCVWSKEICSSLTPENTGGKKGVERLFVIGAQ